MEDRRSRDQPENCKPAGSEVAFTPTDAACKPKARLRRHRSLEDISSQSLKTTQEQNALSIFVEYCAQNRMAVNNSLSARTMPIGQLHTDSISCSYRRLKSEPNSSVSCSIDAPPRNSKREEHSQATPSRPCTLTLGAKHQRMPSSDSSGKATPAAAPDPPLFSPEGLQQYPLASHRSRSASSPFPPSHVETGEVQSQSHLCAAQCGVLLPALINRYSMDAERQVYSKMIADRIRSIGDRYARKFGEDQLERKLMSIVLHQNPANMNLTSALSVLRGALSWQKVSEIFQVGYNLLEMLTAEFGPDKLPQGDKRWTLFQMLWDIMMSTVAPWIWEHGGGIESLRAMQRMEGVNVTTFAATDYQCHMEPLSSPALRRDCRLYSLTESGIFVNAEGNTMDADQEVVRLNQREEEEEEPSEVCHQTSTGLQRVALTLEPDSPFPCPMDTMHSSGRPLHVLTSTPGATSTHSQEDGELLDSGIVSSTEQLSLESHDADSCIDEDTFSPMVTMATNKSSQMTPFQRKCSSMRVKGSQSSKDGHAFDRNRSKSLPGSSKKKRTKREVKSAPLRREKPEYAQRRRTSETALIYTVNISAALAYAAVSNLFK